MDSSDGFMADVADHFDKGDTVEVKNPQNKYVGELVSVDIGTMSVVLTNAYKIGPQASWVDVESAFVGDIQWMHKNPHPLPEEAEDE